MADWTIQKLLNWIIEYFTNKGVESPRLSAELLLSHVLGLKRIELYTQFDKPVPSEQLEHLRNLVKRTGQNEPVAYLVGRTEFYSMEIKVTPDCLIPRPETELLVERAIEFLRKQNPGTQYICDLCERMDGNLWFHIEMWDGVLTKAPKDVAGMLQLRCSTSQSNSEFHENLRKLLPLEEDEYFPSCIKENADTFYGLGRSVIKEDLVFQNMAYILRNFMRRFGDFDEQ